MFFAFALSLAWHKCKTEGFNSRKGTLYFNIWALIYEKIETSTLSMLLKCLGLAGKAPAPPPAAPQQPQSHRDGARAFLAFPAASPQIPAPGSPPRSPQAPPPGGLVATIRTLFANRIDSRVQARPSRLAAPLVPSCDGAPPELSLRAPRLLRFRSIPQTLPRVPATPFPWEPGGLKVGPGRGRGDNRL